jgi:hypothetical protein
LGEGSALPPTLGKDGKEVTVDLDATIQKLTERLGTANAREAARIRTRITELKALQKEHATP